MLSPTSTPSVPEAPTPAAHAQNFDRFGARSWNYLKAWFGLPHQRRLAYAGLQVPHVRHFEAEFSKLSDVEVRHMARAVGASAVGPAAAESA